MAAMDTSSHSIARNEGMPLDMGWVERSRVNLPAVNRRAATHMKRRSVKKGYQAAWLLRGISCIDLTTLAGSDTPGNGNELTGVVLYFCAHVYCLETLPSIVEHCFSDFLSHALDL